MTDPLAAWQAAQPGLVESTLRLATWNLWWRYGPWAERQDAIAATLRAADPDVVTLQEVWKDDERHQAAELAAALGDHHQVYVHRPDGSGVGFGNAVLSRWPITAHECRPLPPHPDRDELRTMLRADIDGPRGPLSVFTTHLNHRLDHSATRQEQVRAISEFVRETAIPGQPAVVTGDFNAVPDSDEIRMMTGRMAAPAPPVVFQDVWEQAAGGGPGHTWSPTNPFAAVHAEPPARIDYVFTAWPSLHGRGAAKAVRLLGDEPVAGLWGSDHFGVLAELRY